jgi:hypothetical protein
VEPWGSLTCSQESATGPYLIQMNPVHTLIPCFPKINFNIIVPSTFRSFKWFLPFRLPNQMFLRINLPHAWYMLRPSHTPHGIQTYRRFNPEKRTLIPAEQEAARAPEPVWTLWRREEFFPTGESNPESPIMQSSDYSVWAILAPKRFISEI